MKALIIVDVQNDFCTGGALPVQGGENIIPYINNDMQNHDLVIATKDWHPSDHSSFFSNNEKGIWANHCVKGSYGAELHKNLNTEGIDFIFSKGYNKEVDSYSGFFDENRQSTGLGEFLAQKGITEVTIVGLAFEYCVKFTAFDACSLGFKTTIDMNGTRALESYFKTLKECIGKRIKLKERI